MCKIEPACDSSCVHVGSDMEAAVTVIRLGPVLIMCLVYQISFQTV